MRTVLTLILLVFVSCSAKNNSTLVLTQSVSPSVSIDELMENYAKCSANSTLENQLSYFHSFPSENEAFEQVFGLDVLNDSVIEAPLYNESFDYVSLFFSLDSVETGEVINKLTTLIVNLEWEADAVNFLQYNLIELANSNPLLTAECLNKYEKERIENFWRFYFAGPVAPENTPEEFGFLESTNPKIFNSMQVQWDNVHEERE